MHKRVLHYPTSGRNENDGYGKGKIRSEPYGALHIGGGHTALFNWLWPATWAEGSFSGSRTQTGSGPPRNMRKPSCRACAGSASTGTKARAGGDYGPYRQSERLPLYHKYADQLVAEGKAYREGDAVIFKNPEGVKLAFDDVVYGHIEVMSETLKDTVLIKSDGMPTYNYAVVIDDHCMGITHVIRGEDHISTRPSNSSSMTLSDGTTPLSGIFP